MQNIKQQLENVFGKKLQTKVSLAQFTSTEVGGKADFLIECEKEEELIEALRVVKKFDIPYLVIGGGTNLLISDDDFCGLAIVNRVWELMQKDGIIYASSGVSLLKLINFGAERGFGGMEKLAGIPGSVGGAIYGNAGAYGQSTSDTLVRIKIFDGEKVSWVDQKDGQFGYRMSIFKETKPVILGGEFNLVRENTGTVQKTVREMLLERAKKYSGKLRCPGSFFKNVEVEKITPEALAKIPKDKIVFGKIPAGYLLEEVGAKCVEVGKIKVSDFHANFFINTGGGTAREYQTLITTLRQKVKDKFGIELEPEVQMINFADNSLTGKNVAVLGLGLEGRDLVHYLISQKVKVTVLDQKEKLELDLTGIDLEKISLITGPSYLKGGLEGFDIVFRSPGFYRYSPELIKAEKKGVQISSALKLFFDRRPAKIIGVTGTKGKGTTSSLIYEILKKAGKKVHLVGNIGKPYLKLLSGLTPDQYVVMELSSFQLIDLDKSPYLAVVLNITLDHMDWHKSREEYVGAKTNIVTHQGQNDLAVISADYETPQGFAPKTKAKTYFFSRHQKVKGCYVSEGEIILNVDGKEKSLGKTTNLLLRGEHNWENITAAALSGKLLGVSEKIISQSIFSFKGLEHRLELVGKYQGRTFYNDSFATGPQPTMAAIASFTEPVTVILGGYDKGLDYAEMVSEIVKKKDINVVLVGNIGKKLEKMFLGAKFKGKIVNTGKQKMAKIVAESVRLTPKGGVVLLSPAAASFDMFTNYKERGKLFKGAVKALAK